jgi:hypothetical protein
MVPRPHRQTGSGVKVLRAETLNENIPCIMQAILIKHKIVSEHSQKTPVWMSGQHLLGDVGGSLVVVNHPGLDGSWVSDISRV